MPDDNIDQTEDDVVTGVDVVDGTLVFKRHDGSTENVVLGDLLEDAPIASASQAAVVSTGATNTTPYGYSQAQANAIVTLVNALRDALITAGIIKGSA